MSKESMQGEEDRIWIGQILAALHDRVVKLGPSRHLSLVVTKIDEAALWFEQEWAQFRNLHGIRYQSIGPRHAKRADIERVVSQVQELFGGETDLSIAVCEAIESLPVPEGE